MKKLQDQLGRAVPELIVCSLLLIIMVAAATIGVFWRYVLASPLAWPEELARFAFIWFGYMAMCYCILNEGHIVMAILPTFFKNQNHIVLFIIRTFAKLIIMAVLLYFARHSVVLMMKTYNTGELSSGMHLPMWLVYLSLPTGFVLCTLRLVQEFFVELRARKLNK